MFIHKVYADKGFHFSFVMSKDYTGGKQSFPLIFTAVGPIFFVSCFREEGILVSRPTWEWGFYYLQIICPFTGLSPLPGQKPHHPGQSLDLKMLIRTLLQ